MPRSSTATATATCKRVYCANCVNCKLVRTPSDDDEGFVLRVRCAAGKWRKKLGGEKMYKYFTVVRRVMEECDAYEPMGDESEFLKDLKSTLPLKDELYS